MRYPGALDAGAATDAASGFPATSAAYAAASTGVRGAIGDDRAAAASKQWSSPWARDDGSAPATLDCAAPAVPSRS